MASFPYRPLVSPDVKKRVLLPVFNTPSKSLEAETEPQPTSWRLVEDQIEEPHHQYHALSYAWDADDKSASVIVDGVSVSISVTLENALEKIYRSYSGSGNGLWADALCINQQDDAEKSHQVQQMYKIFSKACKVLVWLGPADEESDSAMRQIAKLAQKVIDYELWKPGHEFKPFVPKRTRRKIKDRVAQIGSEEDARACMMQLQYILRRRWFERIWVLQELAVAHDADVICGDLVISWERFRVVLQLFPVLLNYFYGLITSDSLLSSPPPHASVLTSMSHSYDRFNSMLLTCTGLPRQNETVRSSTGPGLGSLLRQSSFENVALKTSDPRDRVYGLLGLADDSAARDIVVDYSKSVEEVYIDVVKALLKYSPRNRKLDFLSFCANWEEVSRSDLPSWVPDWRCHPVLGSLLGRKLISEADVGYLGARVLNHDAVILEGRGKTILALKGALEGRILDLGDLISMTDDDDLEAIRQLLEQLMGFVKASCRYPTETTARESIVCKTAAAEFEYRTTETWRQHSIVKSKYGYKVLVGVIKPEGSSLGEKARWVLQESWHYLMSVKVVARQRRCFMSSDGYVGMGPIGLRQGDHIALLQGTDVPFALREQEDGNYLLIGELYVHGMMDGELEQRDRLAGTSREDVDIHLC